MNGLGRNNDNKEPLWDDEINGFPYKYEFSSYRGGKVPAIVSYENGNKVDYIIYHNDVINNNVVQESFFEELIGNSYSEEELEQIFNSLKIKQRYFVGGNHDDYSLSLYNNFNFLNLLFW